MSPNPAHICGKIDAWLPRLYLAIALPMMVFFALAVPPFQVPDEFAHLFRADQISHGEIIGSRPDAKNSGGLVDDAWLQLSQIFTGPVDSFCLIPGWLAPTAPSPAMMKAAAALMPGGHRTFASCPVTVLYGPVMYMPQATALALARAASLNALQAFYLARCVNGCAVLAVGFLALRLARRGRFVIFCLLTMPMTLFLTGSVSQEGLLLACTALFCAGASRSLEGRPAHGIWTHLGLMALLAAIACGRLPYLVLGIFFLSKPVAAMRWRGRIHQRWPGIAALCGAVILTGIWARIVGPLQMDLFPLTSAARQTHFLMEHLNLVPHIAIDSVNLKMMGFELFGVLGWLIVFLPQFFYWLAAANLAAALVLETTRACRLKLFERVTVASAMLAGCGLIYLALYLTWTPVGQLKVEGVQGRYFIPFFFGLALAVPTLAPRFNKLLHPLMLFLPLAALCESVVALVTIMDRYY